MLTQRAARRNWQRPKVFYGDVILGIDTYTQLAASAAVSATIE